MIVVGIAPGIRGGLAIVAVEDGAAPRLIDAIDVPVIGIGAKERVNIAAIGAWIGQHDVQHAFIERAQALPKQGSSTQIRQSDRRDRSDDRAERDSSDHRRAVNLETVLATPWQGQRKLAAESSAAISGRASSTRAQERSRAR
jgi:hypothetical protein